MRRLLQLIALVLALGTAGFWAAKGAHRGWSQHRVPVKQVDEVTGLDHITYEDRYVPGIEVLGGGLALAGLLALGSLFLSRPVNPNST
jgi:hypothetical protein